MTNLALAPAGAASRRGPDDGGRAGRPHPAAAPARPLGAFGRAPGTYHTNPRDRSRHAQLVRRPLPRRHARDGLLPDRGRSARTLGRQRMRARPPPRRPHRKVRLLAAGERTESRSPSGHDRRKAHGRPPDTRWAARVCTAARSATAPPGSRASSSYAHGTGSWCRPSSNARCARRGGAARVPAPARTAPPPTRASRPHARAATPPATRTSAARSAASSPATATPTTQTARAGTRTTSHGSST